MAFDRRLKPEVDPLWSTHSPAHTAGAAPPLEHPLAGPVHAPSPAPAATAAAQVFGGMFDAAAPTQATAVTGGAVAPAATANTHHVPTDPAARKVYEANAQRIAHLHLNPSKSQQQDLKSFEANYAKHKAEYEQVAAKSDLPPELIAALHWRESSGNFHTYLAQGDPLGKPAVHVPRGEPVRTDWGLAAQDALNDHRGTQTKLDLHKDSTDLAGIATYAEYYNGLGYSHKGKPSPYVFSGTDQYTSGKYIRDGVYSAKTKDTQLGVVAMVQDLFEKEHQQDQSKQPPK